MFAENYNLPKLEEVATFIKQNNGLHLAEMNIKLLQKVEELTLYTLEQENELATQQEAMK